MRGKKINKLHNSDSSADSVAWIIIGVLLSGAVILLVFVTYNYIRKRQGKVLVYFGLFFGGFSFCFKFLGLLVLFCLFVYSVYLFVHVYLFFFRRQRRNPRQPLDEILQMVTNIFFLLLSENYLNRMPEKLNSVK